MHLFSLITRGTKISILYVCEFVNMNKYIIIKKRNMQNDNPAESGKGSKHREFDTIGSNITTELD